MLRILTPWDSQPQGATAPDARWIQRGLVFANDGAGTIWTPAGFRLSAVDAGTPKRNATNYGIAVGYGTTHGTGTSDRSTDGVVPLRNTFRTIVSANFARSIGLGGAGRIMTPAGSAELSFEFFCPDPTSSGLLYTRQSAGGSLYGQWYSTTALTFGRWQVVGVSQDQSGTPGTPAMYLDGQAVGVSAYTTSAGAASNLSYTLDRGNRDSDSARSWDGFLGPLYIFESILTAAEHAELAGNPWALYAPRSIWVPVSVGGGSVTGTSATTNANDTSAASGTTTVIGTSATTNVADTSTASGSVGGAVTGTSATTNANDTSSASGTTTVTGTVAYSNANDTPTASGWAGLISGTVAVTNADDTSAAVGNAGPAQVARLFAGGFPRREQFRKGYIIKGKRYWLTEEELAVMVAQMLAEISRGDIKQVTAGKPKTISKKTWDAIQIEARIEAVAKQFDDTDEDEDEPILMML